MSLKLISLWQPWASAVVTENPFHSKGPAQKRFETRHWESDYVGPLLIHATLMFPDGNVYNKNHFMQQDYTWDELCKLPRGAIVGMVHMTNCFTTFGAHNFMKVSGFTETEIDRENAYGDFSPGRFAFLFQDALKFQKPIPHKGRQGKLIPYDDIYNLPDEAMSWLHDHNYQHLF